MRNIKAERILAYKAVDDRSSYPLENRDYPFFQTEEKVQKKKKIFFLSVLHEEKAIFSLPGFFVSPGSEITFQSYGLIWRFFILRSR